MWDISKAGEKKIPPLTIIAVFSFPMLMQERTRSALLESLFEELQLRSRSMMGLPVGEDDKMENGSGGFLENFKVSHSGVRTCPGAHVFLKLIARPPKEYWPFWSAVLRVRPKNQLSIQQPFSGAPPAVLYLTSQERTFSPFLCSFLQSCSTVQGGIPSCPWEVKLFMLHAGVWCHVGFHSTTYRRRSVCKRNCSD